MPKMSNSGKFRWTFSETEGFIMKNAVGGTE
jgi:hypothetical protein